ncbi:uncharacterized protein LAESUDRAFT_761244 [Laetiporus sulphureus 93-53]|uniref:KOW domain-containing protein n=1 Tax=Laetiporus sulphureus 93-53 TaxID=1314785 RepID=A0A165DA71_9APHY|nr:uncharacterized protein LAESUDRAFT_761244 [Laetiporus sulphureus 93-53]KZT04425.1 hypothetical protein LAESUDRAFT_761244 [Laetiporus sulphureus 93-53]
MPDNRMLVSQYLDIEAVVDDDGKTEVMEEDDQPLSDFIEDGSVHSEDESSSVWARIPSDHEEGVLEKEIARYCSVRAPELTDPALWMVKTRPNCALRAFCLIFGALAPTAASITQSAGPSDPITQSAGPSDPITQSAGPSDPITQSAGPSDPEGSAALPRRSISPPANPIIQSISLCEKGTPVHRTDRIYIEARALANVVRACSLASHLLLSIQPVHVPLEQRIPLYIFASDTVVAPCFARIAYGLYKWDLAYVEDIQGAIVWAVPRISYSQKRKRSSRPAVQLFDRVKAVEVFGAESVKERKPVAGTLEFGFRNKRFRDRLVRLKYDARSLAPVVDAPREAEISSFMHCSWISPTALNGLIHRAYIASLAIGDCIRVIDGELSGTEGIIQSVTEDRAEVAFGQDDPQVATVLLRSLERFFHSGDSVRVVRGNYRGAKGFVLTSENDKDELRLLIHKKNHEIVVRPRDVIKHELELQFFTALEEPVASSSHSSLHDSSTSSRSLSEIHRKYIMKRVTIIRGGYKGWKGYLTNIWNDRYQVALDAPRGVVLWRPMEEVGLTSDKDEITPFTSIGEMWVPAEKAGEDLSESVAAAGGSTPPWSPDVEPLGPEWPETAEDYRQRAAWVASSDISDISMAVMLDRLAAEASGADASDANVGGPSTAPAEKPPPPDSKFSGSR